MTIEELKIEIARIKLSNAGLKYKARLRDAHYEMDQFIVWHWIRGTLFGCDPNFNWRDLEAQ